jgi:hypothetical protein
MPIKEYTAGIFDQLVVGKTYRVEYYNRDVLLEQSLAKILKKSDWMISFERQKYDHDPALTKPLKKYDVPTHEPNRMHYHYRIFETGEDITDRKLRKPALEQALQTGTMENPKFNEPIINTTMGMANGLFKAGRKYKIRKTKMHKKNKMRTKKNTNKKMKKKQTRTRRKR